MFAPQPGVTPSVKSSRSSHLSIKSVSKAVLCLYVIVVVAMSHPATAWPQSKDNQQPANSPNFHPNRPPSSPFFYPESDPDDGAVGSMSSSSVNCGGAITSFPANFSSPDYPGRYPKNVMCTWEFAAQRGRKLVLAFTSFSLGMTPQCKDEYVEVVDYDATTTYCGHDIPAKVSQSFFGLQLLLCIKYQKYSKGFSSSLALNES